MTSPHWFTEQEPQTSRASDPARSPVPRQHAGRRSVVTDVPSGVPAPDPLALDPLSPITVPDHRWFRPARGRA